MSHLRVRPAHAAWALWAACVGASAFVGIGTIVSAIPVDPEIGTALTIVYALAFVAFPTVGAIIVTKVPGNPIGWLFTGFGAWVLAGLAGDTWARASLPGAPYGAWVVHSTLQSPVVFTFFTFLFLLFPDGRPPSRRWRAFASVPLVASVAFTVLVATRPGTLAESRPPRSNPFAIDAVEPLWLVVADPLALVVMLSVPVSALSFVLRFRRSSGVERQQLKWLVAAGVGLGGIVGLGPVVFAVPALWWIWPILVLVASTGVTAAAGLAILQYRLYDIDRIVSRTMSYAVVTFVLAVVYASMVFGIGAVVPGGSDITVAASTLAVAGLFGPVRRRVQVRVDRRFNRARYDAVLTVETFATKLRSEIDLADVSRDLSKAVTSSLQPTYVSIWIRDRS